MFFRKIPHRLYYPTKSRWYTRPRHRPVMTAQKRLIRMRLLGALAGLFRNRLTFLMAGLFLAILIAILVSSSYLAITNIQIVRENFNVDSAAIESELNIYIGKNLLTFPRHRVVQTINEQFPEFSSVIINKEFPNTIKISLVSHPILANLRAYYVLPAPEEKPQEESSALNRAVQELRPDETGLEPVPVKPPPMEDKEALISAFSLDPQRRKEELAPKPIEQKGLLNDIGQAIFDREENLELMTIEIHGLTQPIEDRAQVIPPQHMDYIRETLRYFENAMNLEVSGLDYLPIAREIHVKTKHGPVIWITTEKDYKEQLDKLKTIYEPAELDKEDLLYIDLRIREKVIYCPRQSPCAR